MRSYNDINLKKGMYQSGKSLTEILEAIDPSENYRGTALEGLDAFSRQLKRFDIKVSGSNSDTVEKFFQCSQSEVLFPEYVRRCVETGLEENQTVKDIVAITTNIEGMDYRSASAIEEKYCVDFIPSFQIKTNGSLCEIHKRGRCLNANYEALRFQRISILSIMLKQIGQYIRKAQLFDALQLIESAQSRIKTTRKQCVIDKSDVHSIAEWLHINGGFDLNVLLGSTATVSILKEQFGDSLRYENGNLYLNQIRVIPTLDGLPCRIVGMDSHYAIEMVECGGIEVDYDKLINKQFERAAICCRAGFSLLNPKAVEVRKW